MPRHSVFSICSFRMVVSSRLPWEHGVLGVTNNDITGGTGTGATFDLKDWGDIALLKAQTEEWRVRSCYFSFGGKLHGKSRKSFTEVTRRRRCESRSQISYCCVGQRCWLLSESYDTSTQCVSKLLICQMLNQWYIYSEHLVLKR
jgi:hypothetical protein